MIRLAMPWTRRRAGRHRVDDRRPHRGWEGREGELQLLAEDPAETTLPIRGLPILPATDTCLIDQCGWPDENLPRPDDFALLEHMRQCHAWIDAARTITRLQAAVTKLQERL